jgi:hypothetical protein
MSLKHICKNLKYLMSRSLLFIKTSVDIVCILKKCDIVIPGDQLWHYYVDMANRIGRQNKIATKAPATKLDMSVLRFTLTHSRALLLLKYMPT